VKIHVRQKAMLRIVGANADGARISVLDVDVDVAHCRVERTRVRIRCSRITPRSSTREEHHIRRPLLKTGRVCGQYKCRPGRSQPDQPNPGPDVDGLSQTVTASRNEQNALIGLVNRVDGLLQGFRIICDSVALYRKSIPSQINSFRIIETCRIVGTGE
jgi:hypothetical protein